MSVIQGVLVSMHSSLKPEVLPFLKKEKGRVFRVAISSYLMSLFSYCQTSSINGSYGLYPLCTIPPWREAGRNLTLSLCVPRSWRLSRVRTLNPFTVGCQVSALSPHSLGL